MLKRESVRDKVFVVVNYTLLAIIACLMIYPLIYVLSASFSNPARTVLGDIWLFPKELTVDLYVKVFQNEKILIGYRNTIIYTVFGTFINLLFSVMIAYPLSRKDFYGRNMITVFIMITMFFSGGMIPTYLLVKDLGMLDTIWAIVLPGAVSVYNVIIMRTFFQSIPNELHEAASIDGCGNISFLLKIVMPLSMPIIAVMTLFYGVGHWNAYFDSLIYLNDESKFPLQLYLRQMLIQEDMSGMSSASDNAISEHLMQIEGLKYAVVIVASLPMLVLYPFLQKYFVKGVMIGSIKG
ncbi:MULTISPECIES: carbohydrate ABC transporter permease [Niallia]|jgi:putative aldouronate transport system permease protein|uniref:carbohydrate ABC transporter permease n=1 Tax=Niallia TaxID=2837506 RepID=UPI0002FE024E|nr:carbohydrate ABC transporter permease [Niallia circulans]AYV68283.1 sugar ABC transporter permease [Niallia circulans]AYV73317.1 sugar ABC transporter permease [Niallia circulans]UQZ75663.1 sugar ABC transporter permease [Niallia circulans]